MSSRSNTTLISHFDCPGGGQVWVEGTTLFIGHMRWPSGTTIVDVADPRQPRKLATIDLPVRQTASLLVAPFEGRGHSIIDGKRFDWQAFDNLAVPGGSWFEHVNGDNRQPAILFVASDEPALKCFHLFKKWGRDAAGSIVKIA